MATVPHIKMPLPGPRAAEIVKRDSKYVSPSYTRDYPFVMAKGEGAVVEDVDGNVFLDCAAGIAVNSTGHAHPDVVRAITTQAQKFLHMSGTDFYYEPQVALAEEIASIVPVGGGSGEVRSFFSNSGAEAIEAAIKLARYASKRFNLIAFLGSFHGRTLGALSVTSSKYVQRRGFGPMLPGVFHAPYANCYRCPVGLRPESCQAECLSFVEDQILIHLVSPDEVAAVLVEPIQGEGGYVVPPRGFLTALRELCDRHGILLVIDEVQSGIGRTGKMFACEYDGVEPDVLLTAKGLGSGMPIGAIIAREDVMKWGPGAHGSTFGGNPVCCAAALATLDLVEGGLMANATPMGDRLRTGLGRLAERHATLGDVRGLGLMIGVDIVTDRATREPAPRLVHELVQRAFRRGLLLLGAGKSALRLAPPLVIDSSDVDTALGIIDEVLEELR